MKILLVGGSSDLGRELAKTLPYEFINSDITDDNKYASKYIFSDLTEKETLSFLDSNHYDAVIHIAGIHPIIKNDKNEPLMFDVNVKGVYNVLEKVKESKSNYIYISSSSAKNLKNNYGMTKYLAEQLVEAYSKNYGIKSYSLRTRGFTPYYSKAYKSFTDYANWVLSGAVHIKDVVRCIDLCLKNPVSHELFLVDGKNDFTTKELSNWNTEMLNEKYPDFKEFIKSLNIPKNPPTYSQIQNRAGYVPSIGIDYLFQEFLDYSKK